MSLSDWASISSAISAFISAIALYSGYYLYLLSQRDQHSSNTKKSLIRARDACNQIKRFVTFDLAHEIVESVIYSREMTFQLNRIWNKFFTEESKNKISEEEFCSYLEDSFPPITIPIHTYLLERIDNIRNETQSDLAYLQNDYPGLYRVIAPVLSVLTAVVINYTNEARDENTWRKLLAGIRKQEKFDSFDYFQNRLLSIYVSFLLSHLQKRDKSDIADLLLALDIVSDSYLGLGSRALYDLSKKEKKISFLSLRKTTKINEDLREAEKILKDILLQEDLLKYRELIVKVEQRNS